MEKGWMCSRVFLLFVAIFLAPISTVQSQDLFSEMDQLKRELSDLKNEVSDLTNVVYDLRKAVLKSVSGKDQQTYDKAPTKEEKAPQPMPPVDEKQVTRTACRGDWQIL